MSVFYLSGFEIQNIKQRTQNYHYHLHHEFYEIRLMISGEEIFCCPRNKKTNGEKVVAGDILVLHPDEPHQGSFISCDYSQYRLYYISDEYLSFITGVQPCFENLVIKDKELFDRLFAIHEVLEHNSYHLNRATNQCTSDRFTDIAELCRSNIRGARYDLRLALNDLVSKYGSTPLQKVSPEIARIKEYYSDYYKSSENLYQTAQNLCISKSKLSHQFEKEVHISPDLYRRMLQLEHSKLLLARDEKKVSDALELVGFKNFAHFSSRFKHYFGLTPRDYKNCFVDEGSLSEHN